MFAPNINELKKQKFGSRPFLKSVQNPPKTGYKRVYLPFLTFTVRAKQTGIEEELRVEFSCPKLLFRNNVQEIDEKDFDLLIQTLRQKLIDMGVWTPQNYLPYAQVSRVHFCKNVVLDNFITANYVIRKLAKFDVSKKLDINEKRFDNFGRGLYFYSGAHSFIIYDKINDLNTPGNRGIDRDKTVFQKNLFDYFQKEKEPLEILRFEIRLKKKQKLLSVLNKVGVTLDKPRFKFLFNKGLAQKVILFYWNSFFRNTKYQFLLSRPKKPDDLIENILNYLKYDNYQVKSKRIQYKIAFSLLGFYLYAQEHGIRSLRYIIENSFDKRTWCRANKDFEILSKILEQSKKEAFMNQIDEALEKFETYKPNLGLVNVN